MQSEAKDVSESNHQGVGDQSVVTSSQPNRFLWFFRLDESCSVGNACTAYLTNDRDEAIRWYESECGGHVLDARQRELTFEEYCGLLMCNREDSEHLKRVYNAMQDLFYRCDPRSS